MLQQLFLYFLQFRTCFSFIYAALQFINKFTNFLFHFVVWREACARFSIWKKKLYKGETKINTIADRHTNLKVIYSLLFEHKKNAENWNNWEKQL